MIRRAESPPARIVKAALDITFWLGIVAGTLLAAWLFVSPWVLTRSDGPTDVSVPVTIGRGSLVPVLELSIAVPDTAQSPPILTRPRLVKGRGELRLDTKQWEWHLLTGLIHLLGVAVGLWVVYLLRRVVAAVLAGAPFASSNASHVRLIGFILMGSGLVMPSLEWLTSRLVLANVAIENVNLGPPTGFRADPILAGLLVLVLATIFDRGSRLERDQSLTI